MIVLIAIYNILSFMIVYYSSVVWHELSHLLFFPKKGVKVYSSNILTFEVGTDDDYKDLTKEEHKEMLTFGIMGGFVPLLVYWIISGQTFYFIVLILIYIYGCRHDIKAISYLVG